MLGSWFSDFDVLFLYNLKPFKEYLNKVDCKVESIVD